MQGARRITHPTGIETHVDNHVLDFRQAPAVAIVEEKTSPDTEGVLAEVALRAPGRFAAFDDLITLTMRAADRDECHGPFLPKRDYEDEAQCDSNLSPSPLLKHYPGGDAANPSLPAALHAPGGGVRAVASRGGAGREVRGRGADDHDAARPLLGGRGPAGAVDHCREGCGRTRPDRAAGRLAPGGPGAPRRDAPGGVRRGASWGRALPARIFCNDHGPSNSDR